MITEPEERQAWLAARPQVIGQARERWSLTIGEPFPPGGQTAWVAPARDGAGADLVLKVGWPHPEAAHEADGLRAWAGPAPSVCTPRMISVRPGRCSWSGAGRAPSCPPGPNPSRTR